MTIQIGISRFGYGGEGGGGALIPHDHSTPAEGGSVPLSSVSGHSKGIHDGLAINADQVDGEEASAIVTNARVKAHFPALIVDVLSDHSKAVHDALAIAPGLHKTSHELAGNDEVDHDVLKGYLGVQHCTLPNSLSNVITNHDKAIHDALAIDAYFVQGEAPNGIVTNARVKAHFPDSIANILSNHTKSIHESLGLIGGNIPSCRVRRIGDQSIPERSVTKIIWNSKEDGWDNLNNWSTAQSEFTVPSGHAGRYLCILVLEFEQMGDDANNKIAGGIKTDRTSKEMQNITFGQWLPVHTGIYSLTLVGTVDVVVGNKIWAWCEQYNDASENRNLSGDPRYSFFCIQKMID